MKEELKKNYSIVDKGYNCFPTNVPGSPYRKALQVSVILVTSLNYYELNLKVHEN